MNQILDEEQHRFEFGSNWQNFLGLLDEERIDEARRSLVEMLGQPDLHGRIFLDIGCGSGLFSLAARRLGAQVFSFDYDPASVACAMELKRRFFPRDEKWQIEQGSVLDQAYLKKYPSADIVYSWGVLHHTGRMWEAMENASKCTAPGGTLFISIYNDQGVTSKRWRAVKRVYNTLPRWLRLPYVLCVVAPFELRSFVSNVVRMRPNVYFERWRRYKTSRGMSQWYDWVDWIGGYPFEVAKPEDVIHYFQDRGYLLRRLKTVGGSLGCNEYVFRKAA